MEVLGNVIIKNLVARSRPFLIDTSIPLLIKAPSGYSLIIYKCDKKWGIVAYVVASLIAFSRLYLFVHFPSDVLAGAVLGIVFGNLIYKLFMKYSKDELK